MTSSPAGAGRAAARCRRWRPARVGAGAGARRRGVGGAARPAWCAVFDEADDVAQGGVVAQVEGVVAGDAVALADGGEHLGLFDGVDAEVGFEVEVGVEHVGRVAGLGGDDLQDRGGDVLTRGRGLGRRDRRRGRDGLGRRDRRRGWRRAQRPRPARAVRRAPGARPAPGWRRARRPRPARWEPACARAAGPVSITRRRRLTTSSCGSASPVRPRSHVFQTAGSAIR